MEVIQFYYSFQNRSTVTETQKKIKTAAAIFQGIKKEPLSSVSVGVLYRPFNGMTFILEFHTAYLADTDFSLASGAVGEELVNRTKVAWLASAAVVMTCHNHLVTEPQCFAPAAFQIFRSGRIR